MYAKATAMEKPMASLASSPHCMLSNAAFRAPRFESGGECDAATFDRTEPAASNGDVQAEILNAS